MAEQTLASLSVQITAQGDKFAAELAKVDQRLSSFEKSTGARVAKIQASFDSLSSTVSTVQGAFGKLAAAAALGGLTEMAKGALEAGDNIADLSKQLNISTDALQELQFAFSQSGSSAEAFRAGFQALQKNVGDAAAGIGRAKEIFKGLGIDAKQFAVDLAQNPTKALEQFADRIAAIKNPAQQTAAVLRLVGDPTWVGVLKQGGGALADLATQAHTSGNVMESSIVAAADDINDKFNAATSAIKTQLQSALISLGPTLLNTAQGFASVTVEVGNLIDKFFGLSEAGVSAALEDVRTEIEKTRQALQSATGVPSLFSKEGLKQLGSTILGGGEAGLIPLPQNELLKQQLATLEGQAASLTQRLEEMQAAHKDNAAAATQAGAAELDFSKKTDEAAKKLKSAREEIEQNIAVLKAQNAILAERLAGQIGTSEAEAKIAAAEKGANAQSQELTNALAKETLARDQNKNAIAQQDKAIEDLTSRLADYNKSLQDTETSLQTEAQAQQAGFAALKNSIAAGKTFEEAQRDQADAIELTTFWWQEYRKALDKGLPEDAAHQFANELTVLKDNTIKAKEAMEDYEKKTKEAIDQALLKTSDLEQVVTGILTQGPKKLGDIVEAFGQTMGIRLVKGILFGKSQNEQAIIGNFNQLLGVDAAGLFGNQGIQLGNSLIGNIINTVSSGASSLLQLAGINVGNLFASSAVDAASVTWSSASDSIFNAGGAPLASIQTAGSSLGTLFGGAMAGAAGVAFGKGLAGLFGIGGSAEASKGGNVGGIVGGIGGFLLGGPPGAGIGAAVGGFFGSLFGGLFEHIPTKGTQIRKGVVDWLKDIKASFADEINSKNYFFDETKTLAKQMFGGDFLQASERILKDKAGPALANQLTALGAFITANQAQQLGKSVEQTGTTFGNLLIANLGIDAIPEAIQEIIQKGNIGLGDITDKLNALFKRGAISSEFFKNAISGAVNIFTQDLPEAIHVASIAAQSFADDGAFDLEKFTRSVKEATDTFDVIGAAFRNALLNSQDGEDAAEQFGKGLEKGLAQLAVDKFITDFISNKLFEGIDLSNGLDSTEIDLLRQRVHDAREEANGLIAALNGDATAMDGVTSSAQDLVDQIVALNTQMEKLANTRIQVQIDFASQLGAIGALTPTQVIAAKEAPLIPTVNQFLPQRAGGNLGIGPIGTQPTAGLLATMTDQQLQQGFDAITQMGDLAVQRFQEFENEQNAALQQQIAAINTETQTTIQGIQSQFQAKQQAAQSEMENLNALRQQKQQVYQEEVTALNTQLQTAQQFKQVSQSIQQTINSLVTSSSPLSGSEQLAFFQRQASDLRTQIAQATGTEQANLIQELSQNLSSQLSTGQRFLDPTAFAALFGDVTTELQNLRDKTAAEGDKAAMLQQQIADTQQEMNTALASIDDQIQAQQKYIQSLATDEQNAIATAQKDGADRITAAQNETKAAIDAYRQVVLQRLTDLAKARDDILKEQLSRLENQRDLLKQQLTDQFGAEEAERLLKDPMLETGRRLLEANTHLVDIRDLLKGFLTAITPAATGFSGVVTRPRLFLAGEQGAEQVNIGPVGNAGAASGTVNFEAGSIVVHVPEATPEQAKTFAVMLSRYAAQEIDQLLMDRYKRGPLGPAVQTNINRGPR